MIEVKDIVREIERFAPKKLAEEWDPVGLSFGTFNQPVQKVLIALDLDPNTLAEAIELGVDFILTHHPLIFKPVATLNGEDPKRQLYLDLIRHHIALYSAHTNVDAARDGMNDWLAKALELEETTPLAASPLDDHHPMASETGIGRIGYWREPKKLFEVLAFIEKNLMTSGLRYGIIPGTEDFQKIAVLGGSGASYYREALRQGVDLFITGDISYHDGQDMLRDGLSFVDVGHFAEFIFVDYMEKFLKDCAEANDWSIEIYKTKMQKDVFTFYRGED